jgi:pyrroline-5-carboxylate reductase
VELKSIKSNGTLKTKVIAILGAGKMGSLLAASLVRDVGVDPQRVRATVKHADRARALTEKLGVTVTTDNRAAVQGADIVFVCVKPQYVSALLQEIRPVLASAAVVISIATSITTQSIEEALGEGTSVVRAMPNTACRIGAGMTALCRGQHATELAMSQAAELFAAMGKTAEVDEFLMDAVTGLSASGPAFVYIIVEALAEGGVRAGLPRELATLLAAQATLGAASMVLHTGEHPAVLKSEVTTPGGCTIDGILELEDGKIRATLIRAIATTAAKAARMLPHPRPAASEKSSVKPMKYATVIETGD